MRTHLCFQILLITFYMSLFCVSGQCQNEQRSILFQLKSSLQLDSSLSAKLVSWNTNDTDCCTWRGISCSSGGEIIGLDLSNERISGGIDDSSAIFSLKNLQNLNLAENNFNFTQISTGFGRLISLKYLNLSNSFFSGQVPGELSQLTRLEVLDLSSFKTEWPLKLEKPNLGMLVQNFTQLRQLYLDSINISAQNSDWGQVLSSSLPYLEVLSLSGCQLSGPLDGSLQKLQSLSVILLAENNLSSPVPNFFANFRNLSILDLRSCNLQGIFPEKVLQLQSLQLLDLSNNTNLGGSLPDFPLNGSLRRIVLSDTNFSGGIPESIGNLKNLFLIDFSRSNFTGQIPSFKQCKNLTSVDLSENLLSGLIPSSHFQDLQNLVWVDLSFNAFNGNIPSSLFSLQQLLGIRLSYNHFDGPLPNFTNASASLLYFLDLSSNKLEGEIPRSFFELGRLTILYLSSNNLSGLIQTKDFQGLSNLTNLDLSFNSLTIKESYINSVSHLPMFIELMLASCNLQNFPNLQNQSTLQGLDLSDNNIYGEIPSWLWNVGNGFLMDLNLSHNQLTSLEEPYNFIGMNVLDLHSNNLSGVIPVLPDAALIIDYSYNNFNSSLPETIGTSLHRANFFSVANNLLTDTIPTSICNATNLLVLDLSNNRFTGRIPRCLFELGGNLGVLNLGNNNLSGKIEGTFLSSCRLLTLDLHGNSLEGGISRSLVNCTMLEVLNIGKNKINDTYPCFLGDITNMKVLVLRSNRLHGSLWCGESQQNKWSKLQILDIAHNNFTGVIPADYFRLWNSMMRNNNGVPSSNISYPVLQVVRSYYQDTVTITIKGLELELVKILTLFTSVDISNNHFSGEIPASIGQLRALLLLNISRNEFTCSIPPSLRNLSELEALDMSSNKLTGEIPSVLADLTFLSVLNLSYNQLEGRIPTGSQLQTFTEASYIGNKQLCGFPLNRSCPTSLVPSSVPSSDESSNEQDWQDSIFYGMGTGAGLVIVLSILRSLHRKGSSGTSR